MNDADVVRQLLASTSVLEARAAPEARDALRRLAAAIESESGASLKSFDIGVSPHGPTYPYG